MFSSDDSYLAKPYAEATLADHRAFQLNYPRGSAFEETLYSFFQTPVTALHMLEQRRPLYDCPQVQRAISACFPDWKLVFEGGSPERYASFGMPKRRRFALRPNRHRDFITEGSQFYVRPDGQKRAIGFDCNSRQEPIFRCSMVGHHDHRSELRQDMTKVEHWLNRHRHYLQGQAIHPDGRLIRRQRPASWDDVILEPEVQQRIMHHTVDFFRHRKLFRQNRIPQRRGILLYGPPGNGKTMIGRILAAQGSWTFVYATSGGLEDKGSMRATFQIARKLRPAILFFEDLDFYASERRGNGRQPTLGELLAQMDGLEANDGLVVMATTNDLSVIEPALKDRPSRFDVVVEIAPPTEHRRRAILQHYLADNTSDDDLLIDVAARTKGFSGAQLRELAVLSVQNAILSGRLTPAGIAQPTTLDFEMALTQQNGKSKRVLGFHNAVADDTTSNRHDR